MTKENHDKSAIRPAQTQEKPGIESQMTPRPLYRAPDYRGSGKLQDQAALVTGGDSEIGRAVCVLFAREGATIINCGSITGLEGSKTLIDYASTKGAIPAFTKSLALNLAN